GDRLFAIPAAAEAAEGRITAQLSSRVTTPDDTPSAECTHHTAASHISATQEDDNEVRGGGDDADDDDLMHEETMDGATRPTHHYAVGDDSPAESAQVPPPVPTTFEEVAVTPSSPAPLAVMVVAASLPNSLHAGSGGSDATGTTASSSGPNPLLPSLLPPTCESRHHDNPLLSTDAAHSAAVAQKQHQPPLPQHHLTQLTYGGTLLVQDLSPCDLEIHSSSIVPALDNDVAAAVNSAVLGGVGGGDDAHHRSPSLSRHRQPVTVGSVSPPAGSPPPPRETLPATLDDGMPRIGHIVLAFSDSDMREYSEEEHQQSTAADPPPSAALPGQVDSTKGVSHIAEKEVIVVNAIDPEQEVELIASEEEETSCEGSTPTYSSDSPCVHAEVDDIGVADDTSVPQQELLPHQQPSMHNDDGEDDAPLFKQQERMSSSAALAVSSNASKKHLASSQVKAPAKHDQQQQGYQPGDQVEARWGASWYPAVVVSVLGKAVEVRWLKDNSTVHMTVKHVRRPKVLKSISTPNAGASHTTAASSDGGQPVHRL
ncbi:Hypothetical protein, putative, partial [Bodo saltans]